MRNVSRSIGGWPCIPWLVLVLAVGLGAPFLMLSASAPLLQKWFSGTDHPAAQDPYFLYSASNVGSILALLSYPLLIEPSWPLPQQASMWSWVCSHRWRCGVSRSRAGRCGSGWRSG